MSSRSSDKARFDGIIIGAGHNGLITAAYLAKAGLKIAVFESRPTVGGGFATEELSVPGYKHNTHATFVKIHDSPAELDLELARYGVSYVFPSAKMALVKRDDCFIVYQDIEATESSIKRISVKDAATFRRMARKWQQWYLDFVLPDLYSTPQPWDKWESEIRRKPGGAEYLDVVLGLSPLEYAKELFESDFCRMALLRGSLAAEYDIRSKGIPPLVFATIISYLAAKTALVRGGSRRVPEALMRIVEEHGGRVFTRQGVSKIVVENGSATGVVLEDGSDVRANRFVASSLNPVHTFLFMVGEDKLPAEIQERIASFKFKMAASFRVFYSLKQRPRFRLSEHTPDVDNAFYYTIGFESIDDLARMEPQVKAGLIPDIVGMTGGITSTHDPSLAPADGCTAYFGTKMPFELADGGAARWVDVAQETADKLQKKLGEYVTNLTSENIIGRFAYTPPDIEAYLPNMINGDVCQGMICNEQLGYNRPWPGMSQYKTFIDRLYLCGASTHPGGHAIGGPGYNAANAIAEGCEIEKWWRAYDPRKVVTL